MARASSRVIVLSPLTLSRLRISGGECDPAGQLSVQTDLEGILARLVEGNVEYQNRAGFHINHSRRRLPELDCALPAEELVPTLVHEADPDGVYPDLRPPPAYPEHQVSTGVNRRKVGQPNMLEHAEHAELSLLVDQGVVGYNGKVEMQLS
jgi:hypothetical protein